MENGQKVSMLEKGKEGQQAGRRACRATGLSASVISQPQLCGLEYIVCPQFLLSVTHWDSDIRVLKVLAFLTKSPT